MIDGCGSFLPESKRSFPSPLVSLYKLSGLSSLFPTSRRFGKYALGYLPEREVHKVDVLAGAFMMIPKPILDVTGGFDEQFFMYAEDIDLSYRIQQQGFHNYYLGDVTIVHFKGESTKKGSLNYVKTFYNAMRLFVKKHYRGAGAWLLRQSLQAGIAARQLITAAAIPFTSTKAKIHPFAEHIVICGDNEQATSAMHLVQKKYHGTGVSICSHLPEPKLVNPRTCLVFCTGSISYTDCIRYMQDGKATSYKWFGKNTHSIVGSDNRNRSGEVLAED